MRKIRNNDIHGAINLLKCKDKRRREFKKEFKKSVENLTANIATYILLEFARNSDEHKSKYSDVLPAPGLTLEHVLPNIHTEEEWPAKDFFKDDDYKDEISIKNLGYRQENMNKYKNHLGNMALLPGRT